MLMKLCRGVKEKKMRITKFQLLASFGGALFCAGLAQAAPETPTAPAVRASAQQVPQQGGVLPLPPRVQKVVSIDKDNSLLVETGDAEFADEREYHIIPVMHVYSGGIARLFGGESIPTEWFVSPALAGGNNAGGNSGINRRGARGATNVRGNVTNPNSNQQSGGFGGTLNGLDRRTRQVGVGAE